ncbi:flagellar biosynthetic protein FliO [Acetivibrio ethanolgignens]|uniref:Flagellar protein n=1 Tax=Acetivibrio ethanolgignens TaxID=290052 RepID=A0A0V8QJD6_9FIRM|nr:flagellar biosynthetic protein FliO [Acetivibrio ethanolgignens]KSV60690.1 hypothetical protein ASU35_00535 [Acetivibrio ethanolgignens]
MFLASALSTIENVFQLIGLLVVFILILAAAYFVTKWVGNTAMEGQKNKNISVIETFRLTPNKFIQIVRLGDTYVAIAVSKDHVEYLTEIDEEKLSLPGAGERQFSSNGDFKEVFSKIIKKKETK